MADWEVASGAGGVRGGDAEAFFEFWAVALGTAGLFFAADEELEVGVATVAGVFVEGHGCDDFRF